MDWNVFVIQTKAGYVGQVTFAQKILWESEVFPETGDKVPMEEDRLRRSSQDSAYEQARKAAADKVLSVCEGLFA